MFWKNKDNSDKKPDTNDKVQSEPKPPDYIEKLLQPTPSKPSEKNSSVYEETLPCDHFKYELKRNCGRLSRFNRWFMSDDQNNLDCDRLKELFFICQKYVSDPQRNLQCLMPLKTYENELARRRIESIKNNDVWELRKEPPSDWNDPLPDWAAERVKDSYWFKMNKKDMK